MLIEKLTLNNFRQYIGEQTIEFSTDRERNVTVLIGVNTSGKTTLIRAFEWILYNKVEFEDKMLLNSNVAGNMQPGETKEVKGTLTIEHNGTTYEITRTQLYTCTGKTVRANPSRTTMMYLQPDGQTKTKVESDFEANIERILPKNLSNYFFFGGERVGTISSRADIESSVKGIMGLDVLANAMNDLRKVSNKFKKGMDYSQNEKAVEISQLLEATISRKVAYEEKLNSIDDQIIYYDSEKEKYETLLRNHQDTAEKQARREQIGKVIDSLNNNVSMAKKDIVSTFSKNAFAFFSLPILKNVIEMLDESSEEFESVPDMTANSIDYILNRGYCICGTHISKDSAAERSLLAERAKQPPEHIGALVRRYREQAMEYVNDSDTYYNSIEDKISALRATQRDLNFRIDEKEELDKQIENSVNIAEYDRHYKNAVAQLKKLDKEKLQTREYIGSCKKDIENYEAALEKYDKANVKNQKISKYIKYTEATFDWISEAYLSREAMVRENLEKKVNGNFQKMYHGYRTVEIDEKYRVKYKDVSTEESEGLKAVKSFAFISGLVDLAKETLSNSKSKEADALPQYYPLVMDAPFSNVDEIHIKNISKLLPESAEQIIMAVMKKDWEPAAEVMAEFVGASYIIEKDHDAEGNEIDTMTHVRKGNWMYV